MRSGGEYMLNCLRVCIDQYESAQAAKGRAYSPLQKAVIEFEDLVEMIAKADKLFDEKGYPQSFQDKRAFNGRKQCSSFVWNPQPLRESKDIIRHRGKIGTYDILIISRRHAAWQGILKDENKNIVGKFNDILQIISYIEHLNHETTEASS